LVRDEPNFKNKYPYPQDFYKALRQLELLGAGESVVSKPAVGKVNPRQLKFDQLTMRMKMSAAFFLGYYLMLPKDILRDPAHPKYPDRTRFVCDPEAPFLRTLPRTEDDNLRKIFASGLREREQSFSFNARTMNRLGRVMYLVCTTGLRDGFLE